MKQICIDISLNSIYGNQKIKKYDSDEDIYQKMKHTVQNYHLLQIGLCVYNFDTVEKKYVAYPYNIYLSPKYYLQSDQIKKQMLQLECFNFMALNGLDYKKIYSSGLPYIRLADKEKVLNYKQKTFNGIGLSKQNREFLSDIIKLVQTYSESDEVKELIVECHSSYLSQKILKKLVGEEIFSHTNLNIDKGNTDSTLIIRKKKSALKAKNLIKVEGENNDNGNIEESKQNTQDGVNQDQEESSTSAESEVDLQGFTLIVEAIISSKKPIIGHYMGLDLFYFYDHFIDVLPNTFLEFIEKVNSAFPYVIDTKVLATNIQSKIKKFPVHLEGLFSKFVHDEKCFNKFHNTILSKDEAYSKYRNEGLMHEAGYDSYITGAALIGMCYYEKFEQESEKKLKGIPQKTKKGIITKEYQEKHDIILKELMCKSIDPKHSPELLNVIFLRTGNTYLLDNEFQKSRALFDINHIKDFIPNTLFIKFQPDIQFEDISNHFSQYGDIEITIVDKDLAYVEYEQFESFEGVEHKLDHIIPLLKNDKFEISKYIDRKRFKAFNVLS